MHIDMQCGLEMADLMLNGWQQIHRRESRSKRGTSTSFQILTTIQLEEDER